MKTLRITSAALLSLFVTFYATAAVKPVQPETNAMALKCKRCGCCGTT